MVKYFFVTVDGSYMDGELLVAGRRVVGCCSSWLPCGEVTVANLIGVPLRLSVICNIEAMSSTNMGMIYMNSDLEPRIVTGIEKLPPEVLNTLGEAAKEAPISNFKDLLRYYSL